MFTTKTVPNPNYRGQMHVARLMTRDVCSCGSILVTRHSTFDRDGERAVRFVCNNCGQSETM